MLIADQWKDYELLDAGGGEKLERWGDILLLRPDPQAIWPAGTVLSGTRSLAAHYHRSASGGGEWEMFRPLPQRWKIRYRDLTFWAGPMGFKHTGLFPEQAVNWDWIRERLSSYGKNAEVLNLFAYTGGATAAATAAGAKVTHVDASKGMTQWAKDNLELSGMADRPIRYIVEDCLRFVLREGRRGRKYQGIIMDPPSYGRGPDGQMWRMEDSIYDLLEACCEILDPEPAFFLLNAYTTGLQPAVLENLLRMTVARGRGGTVTAEEIALPMTRRDLVLPCGACGRWQP